MLTVFNITFFVLKENYIAVEIPSVARSRMHSQDASNERDQDHVRGYFHTHTMFQFQYELIFTCAYACRNMIMMKPVHCSHSLSICAARDYNFDHVCLSNKSCLLSANITLD